ncbi:hypothetical protein TrVE_jg9, partial [Triparma verrucosa]
MTCEIQLKDAITCLSRSAFAALEQPLMDYIRPKLEALGSDEGIKLAKGLFSNDMRSYMQHQWDNNIPFDAYTSCTIMRVKFDVLRADTDADDNVYAKLGAILKWRHASNHGRAGLREVKDLLRSVNGFLELLGSEQHVLLDPLIAAADKLLIAVYNDNTEEVLKAFEAPLVRIAASVLHEELHGFSHAMLNFMVGEGLFHQDVLSLVSKEEDPIDAVELVLLSAFNSKKKVKKNLGSFDKLLLSSDIKSDLHKIAKKSGAALPKDLPSSDDIETVNSMRHGVTAVESDAVTSFASYRALSARVATLRSIYGLQAPHCDTFMANHSLSQPADTFTVTVTGLDLVENSGRLEFRNPAPAKSSSIHERQCCTDLIAAATPAARILCHGNTGHGKTQAVIGALSKLPGSKRWIEASHLPSALEDLAAMGTDQCITYGYQTFTEKTPEERTDNFALECWRELEKGRNNTGWIVVFDDVESDDQLDALLAALPEENGVAFFTMQGAPEVQNSLLTKSVEVPLCTVDEGLDLMYTVIKSTYPPAYNQLCPFEDEHLEKARTLIEELGGLPVLLSLIARKIANESGAYVKFMKKPTVGASPPPHPVLDAYDAFTLNLKGLDEIEGQYVDRQHWKQTCGAVKTVFEPLDESLKEVAFLAAMLSNKKSQYGISAASATLRALSSFLGGKDNLTEEEQVLADVIGGGEDFEKWREDVINFCEVSLIAEKPEENAHFPVPHLHGVNQRAIIALFRKGSSAKALSIERALASFFEVEFLGPALKDKQSKGLLASSLVDNAEHFYKVCLPTGIAKKGKKEETMRVVRAMAKTGRPSTTQAIMKKMEGGSAKVDGTYGHSIIIDSFANSGQPAKAEGWLQKMIDLQDERTKPDEVTYSSVINAWASAEAGREGA